MSPYDAEGRPPSPGAGEPQAAIVAATATARPVEPPPAPPPPAPPLPRRTWLRRGLAAVLGVLLVFVAYSGSGVVLYRYVDPPFTTLTLARYVQGLPVEQRWVPLESISPHLVRAVLLSEDSAYCSHHGVDWAVLREAQDRLEQGGTPRGISTIAMQTSKNLFLWPHRSYIRKAIEIPLALAIDAAWGKRRVLEIYLNIAEWGPGVFGIEAAARHHFGRPATRLTEQQALLLAVSLPSPRLRLASSPSPLVLRLAQRLAIRAQGSSAAFACLEAEPRTVSRRLRVGSATAIFRQLVFAA